MSEAEIKTLDPQLSSDLVSRNLAMEQFEGLTRFNGKGVVEPGLTTGWDVSQDGLEWRFRLRDQLRFSDGEKIDAKLFVKLFDRLNDPATPVPNKALFDVIENVSARDNVVLIRLNRPYPRLPDLLAQPALSAVPMHRIEAVGERWTSERPLVTSGAYRLAEWRLNDHLRLERNPHWHEGAAAIPTVIWRPVTDSLSAMRELLADGGDIVDTYPANRHKWLQERAPDVVHSADYLGSYYFAFNTRKPPFDDARVRKALSMTIEREWIADKVMGIGNTPAWGLLPPGLVDEPYRPEWASWARERRLVEARQLLAQAGYGPDNPLTFEIRFNSSPEHRRVSVAMAAMWAPLGVEAKLFNSEAAIHFAAMLNSDFMMSRSGWIADIATPDNFLFVHSKDNGPGNYSGYANQTYEQKLASALATSDPVRRLAKMREAEKQLIEDMPILPIYYYVSRSLVAPRVTGWQDNVSNVHPSRTLSIP